MNPRILVGLALGGVGLALWLAPGRPGSGPHRATTPESHFAPPSAPTTAVRDTSGAVPASPAGASPVARFDRWLETYQAAPEGAARGVLAGQGAALAERRLEAMRDLIRTNPEAAFQAAVPMAVRARLPAAVQARLEERVSGRGRFGVMVATDFERGTGDVRRELVWQGRRFEAHVYGARLGQGSRENLPFHGIAVGDLLAVHENPVRPLEPGEPVPAASGTETCPVSGRPAETFGTPAAAEVAGHIERYCGAAHINLRNDRLAADAGDEGEGAAGGAGEPPVAADSWSQGPKTCLFMRVAFPDDPTEPITEDAAYGLMDGVNQWFVENSYGTASIIPTVTPLLMLPQPKAWYGQNGTSALLADSREAARAAGYDTDNFHWDIVRHGNISGSGFGYGGLAYVRGKGVWLQSSGTGVAVHELGHNYGLWHANYWTASGDSVIGPGTHSEYGNSFDTMGAASAGANQFNAAFKYQIDWLPDSFVRTITQSGQYRLASFDGPSLLPGQAYALRVRKDYDRNYWLEFRQKFTSKPWLMNGVLLNWDIWNNGVVNSASGTHLLDTLPGTAPGKDDGAVTVGRTFSDVAAGLHLTPVARGGSGADAWIDVVVQLGTFPSNRPPTLVLSADRTTAGTNVPINFLATAADPDGDALAYWWDFGQDSFGPNAAYATKSWSSNAEYVVRCTVSDMKGGLASAHILVGIGAVSNVFRARGRILTDTGAPLAGVRVHNGISGQGYRGTWTDSDGEYVLPNLPAGSNTISAVKYGYTLDRQGWSSPLVLGPHADGLDWTASPLPVVSTTVLQPSLAESNGATARIRLARTGPTNSALTVKLNRSGSAAFNTDYTLSPAPTNSPLQYVFPAGVSMLEITVAAVTDSVGEGPEALRLTLMEDPAYALGPLAEATVTLLDDDAAGRPSVSVSASSSTADNLATEGGQDTGLFVFTRSGGGTQNELILNYTVTGSATPGADYTALAGVAVIPAGETTTSIPFTVLDDPDIETNESVTVTVTASAAYNVSGSPATVWIADDDPATVTILASDLVAREGGGNNASLVITRQGSLAANLVVNYRITGTASNGVDCVLLPGTVTILAGRATATLTVTPVNDALVEGPETLTCTLLGSPTCNIGQPASATVTLQDDEAPTVTLVATDANAAEPGSDTGLLTFTRTGATNSPLTVFFTVSGTAQPGVDYVNPGSSVVIPAGASNVTLTITPLDDAIRESAERILVAVVPDAAYQVSTTTPQLVTLRDDEASGAAVAVGFTAAASSGPEYDTYVALSVNLSTNSGSTVTVDYLVSAGSAEAGADFYSATGRLTFASGTLNQSVIVTLLNDGVAEPAEETVIVTLFNPTNAVLDALDTHTYTILDDDISGTVTVTALDPVASEAGTDPAVFRISRSRTPTNEQTVYFQLAGTAAAGVDYVSPGGLAVIPGGAAFVDVVVVPLDDVTPETNETVLLNLTAAPGGVIGLPDLAVVTLMDDDSDAGLPVVTVTAPDAVAAEPGSDTATFRFARDRGTNAPLTVVFSVGGSATSGTDYNALGTSVTIPAGAWETNLILTARNDATFESNETVVVTLTVNGTYRAGSPAAATAVIADDEPAVSVTALGSSDEEHAFTGEFRLERSGSTASNLTVNFTLAGTAGPADYLPLGTNVVIPAGTNAVHLALVAIEDAEAEGDESVVLTLQPGAGYAVVAPAAATLILHDDEMVLSVEVTAPSTYEADGPAGVFTLTRTGNTNAAFTAYLAFGGTAGAGTDYLPLSNTVIFPPGVRSLPIAITPVDDALFEGHETVVLTIQPHVTYSILGAPTAQVTIIDDEFNRRPVVTVTQPVNAWAWLVSTQSALALEAVATDDGQPVVPGAMDLAWSQVSGPGPVTFGGANGSATDARFPGAGIFVLRATAGDGELTGVADVMVTVNPGPVPPGTNAAPVVEAGPGLTLPAGTTASLEGSVLDDGLPGVPGLTSWWSQVSGPAGVTFGEVSNAQTTALFPVAGTYVLRLAAFDGQAATVDEVTITAEAPPVVRVQAVDSTAAEWGGLGGVDTGWITFTREGGLEAALTVQVALGGSAVNGVDYGLLTNVVLFPPGEAQVSWPLVPLADALAEGEETITVTLLADPAYGVGVPGADTVYLADVPWDDWRSRHFNAGELADALVSGEAADPDLDGMKNLLEYAWNLDPRQAEPGRGLTAGIENVPAGNGTQPGFVVRFPRRIEPRDVLYEVEVSTNLINWTTGPGVTRELLPPIDDRNGVTETVRVQVLGDPGPGGQRFVRLKLTRP